MRFKKLSNDYELIVKANPGYEKLQEKVGDLVVGGKVLEIGTGTGLTALNILQNPEVELCSIDSEEGMISQARENLAEQIADGRLTVEQYDALEYVSAMADASVTCVVSAFTLHNMEQGYRNDLLREIYRVIVPGGAFVNGDKYARDDAKLQQRELETQMEKFGVFDEYGRADLKEQWIQHYIDDEAEDVIMREGESVRVMEDLGFCVEKHWRAGMEAVYVGKK